MKVLVTGAAGQLGQAMVRHLAADHQVTAWTRDTIDLTRHREVRDLVLRLAPAAIINCASYNQVDQAEDHQETALERQRVRGSHAGEGRGRSRRAVDALQHRLCLFRHGLGALHRARSSRTAKRLCAVEAGRRMDGGRRAQALCAAGGEPVWRAPHAQQHGSHCRRRARRASRRRCLSIGWSRPASSPTSSPRRRTCSGRNRSSVCITA